MAMVLIPKRLNDLLEQALQLATELVQDLKDEIDVVQKTLNSVLEKIY